MLPMPDMPAVGDEYTSIDGTCTATVLSTYRDGGCIVDVPQLAMRIRVGYRGPGHFVSTHWGMVKRGGS